MTPSEHKISGSSFYNFSKCPRRVYLDLYGDPKQRGEHSEFTELLWARGVQIEREIIDKIKKKRDLASVEGAPDEASFNQTLKLMNNGESLIYQGVLMHGDYIGRPDLLEKVAEKSSLGDYSYIPSDIKSGRATIDSDGGDIKTHYANQILFYCELLEKIQGKKPAHGKIIDIEGQETIFNISDYAPNYESDKSLIKSLVYDKVEPEPIISGMCKECVWQNPCLKLATATDDLTLLYKLGKQKYELKKNGIETVRDLKGINISDFLLSPKKIKGVGEKTIRQWKQRAEVWVSKKPIIHTKYSFRKAKREIFYDIEDDPSLDHVYLHGFVEVIDGKTAGYKSIFAPKRDDEESAAKKLWDYIDSLTTEDVIYHYGSYEKMRAMRLMNKYNLPSKTMEKFDNLREDLYRIVEKSSDWPLSSYGIKSIAKFLGFKWSSEDASGANSIAWYNEYKKNPDANKDLVDKLLTYNREDCEAMIIVKEYLNTK